MNTLSEFKFSASWYLLAVREAALAELKVRGLGALPTPLATQKPRQRVRVFGRSGTRLRRRGRAGLLDGVDDRRNRPPFGGPQASAGLTHSSSSTRLPSGSTTQPTLIEAWTQFLLAPIGCVKGWPVGRARSAEPARLSGRWRLVGGTQRHHAQRPPASTSSIASGAAGADHPSSSRGPVDPSTSNGSSRAFTLRLPSSPSTAAGRTDRTRVPSDGSRRNVSAPDATSSTSAPLGPQVSPGHEGSAEPSWGIH